MLLSWLDNSYILLVLSVFALYRIPYMVAMEEGPFGVFVWLRSLMGSYDYDEENNVETATGRLFACPLCLGMYFAVVVLGLVVLDHPVSNFLLLWWGLAGAQAFFYNLTRDRS